MGDTALFHPHAVDHRHSIPDHLQPTRIEADGAERTVGGGEHEVTAGRVMRARAVDQMRHRSVGQRHHGHACSRQRSPPRGEEHGMPIR